MATEAELRDLTGLVADIRVDVATIKERTLSQGKTLDEVKDKLESSVSRGEYETRHKELVAETEKAMHVAETARDDNLRREGAQRVWRWLYTAAVAALGAVELYYHH